MNNEILRSSLHIMESSLRSSRSRSHLAHFIIDQVFEWHSLFVNLSGGSLLKLLLMLLPPTLMPPLELLVNVELDDADDKLGQPTPADPATFGEGVRDVLGSLPDAWPKVPFDMGDELSADSAISAAAVAAISSSCRFFSYSVCLPCCISSFVKLAASSPEEEKQSLIHFIINDLAHFHALAKFKRFCRMPFSQKIFQSFEKDWCIDGHRIILSDFRQIALACNLNYQTECCQENIWHDNLWEIFVYR